MNQVTATPERGPDATTEILPWRGGGPGDDDATLEADVSPCGDATWPAEPPRLRLAWRHLGVAAKAAVKSREDAMAATEDEAWELRVLRGEAEARKAADDRAGYAAKRGEIEAYMADMADRRHARDVAWRRRFGIPATLVIVAFVLLATSLAWAFVPAVIVAGVIVAAYGRRVEAAAAVLPPPVADVADVADVAFGERGDPAPNDPDRHDLDGLNEMLQAAGVLDPAKGEVLDTAWGWQQEQNGWSVHMKFPRSVPARQMFARIEEIANFYDTSTRCIVVVPDPDSVRRAWFLRCNRDPLTGLAREAEFGREINVSEGIVVGRSIRGEDVIVCPTSTHALIAGDTRSGKSCFARVVALGGSFDPGVTGAIMDPQGLGGWRPFERRFRVITGRGPETMREIARFMEWLWTIEMERRAPIIEAYTMAEPLIADEPKLNAAMARNRELGCPWFFVIGDELHTQFASTVPYRDDEDKVTCGQVIERAWLEITSRGAAFGIIGVAITQKPSGRNMNTDIRDLFTTRGCAATQVDTTAKMALGDNYRASGMNPKALMLPQNAGAMYLHGAGIKAPAGPWTLAKIDYADLKRVRVLIEAAVDICRRSRPEILPENQWIGPEPGHRVTSATYKDKPALPEVVLTNDVHLERVLSLRAPGEDEVKSTDLVARLQEAWPEDYGHLVVGQGANSLSEFVRGLGFETSKIMRNAHSGVKWEDVPAELPRNARGTEMQRRIGSADGSAPPARGNTSDAERGTPEGEGSLTPAEALLGRMMGLGADPVPRSADTADGGDGS